MLVVLASRIRGVLHVHVVKPQILQQSLVSLRGR